MRLQTVLPLVLLLWTGTEARRHHHQRDEPAPEEAPEQEKGFLGKFVEGFEEADDDCNSPPQWESGPTRSDAANTVHDRGLLHREQASGMERSGSGRLHDRQRLTVLQPEMLSLLFLLPTPEAGRVGRQVHLLGPRERAGTSHRHLCQRMSRHESHHATAGEHG